MNIKEINKRIRLFNKTKNPIIYSSLLDEMDPDRQKCSSCGGEIIYPQTKISCSKDGKIKAFDGCYNTKKTIGNNIYTLQVCWNCLSKKYPNIKNPSRCFNVMSEITAFAFNIPIEDFQKSRNNYAITQQHMIDKYGVNEGKKKWDSYCKRQAETNTYEYKKNKYGWSIEDFKEYNNSRACTLKNFIKRYGDDIGKKKWDSYCKRQSETKSWDYMVDTFGEKKAKEIIIQRLNGIKNNGFSKISQEFFQKLDEKLGQKYTTWYALKNKEIEKQYQNITYKLDYFIEELNICIEFNGSIFHADPRLFEDDSHPNPFNKNLSAKDIREHDKYRYMILQKVFGIKTIVVWEMDYKTLNIDEFIKKIINT